jgi:hypothetical protein
MEVICSFETSVDFQRTTRRYIPEDKTHHNHRCDNLKPHTNLLQFWWNRVYKLQENKLDKFQAVNG